MNEREIAELFVRAAETERKMPRPDGMKEDWGGYTLPWVHSRNDIVDRRVTGLRSENLKPGDDPLERWRWEMIESWGKQASREQVTDWEVCLFASINAVRSANDRRALWAWAFAQAGGKSFAQWCRSVERIAEMTGHRRKKRALAAISARLGGRPQMHDETGILGLLRCEPDFRHVPATLEGGRAVHDAAPVHKVTWRDDPAFRIGGLSIVEQRAEDRRQRDAAKREAKRAA